MNMSDGIDGLLGSMAVVSFAGIAFLASQSSAPEIALLALVMAGLISGFLVFNLGVFGFEMKVFLGDSGSMVIGMVLALLLLHLSQNVASAVTPTSVGWLLGLPLLDTASVVVRRISQRRSPFAAGREHFHHILQDAGLSKNTTLKVLVSIQLLMVLVGVSANFTDLGQHLFFWGFVAATVTQYVGLTLFARMKLHGEITGEGIRRHDVGKAQS